MTASELRYYHSGSILRQALTSTPAIRLIKVSEYFFWLPGHPFYGRVKLRTVSEILQEPRPLAHLSFQLSFFFFKRLPFS